MKRNKWLIISLTLGLLLRLYLSYFQYSGDLKNHLVWGESALSNPIGFFSLHFPGFNDPNYPPLAIIAFGISIFLYQISIQIVTFLNHTLAFFPSMLVPLFLSENMVFAYLKFFPILSDIGISFLIYKFSTKTNHVPKYFFLLYLFNPAVIYTSSTWGQTESLTLFFVILSLYLGIKKRTPSSVVVFALAALVKQTALWLAPFYLVLWFREKNKKILIKSFILGLGVFFLSYLTFGLLPPGALKSYFSTLSGSSTVVSDAAWNIWYFLFPGRVEDSVSIGFLTVRQISLALLFLSLTFLMQKLIKQFAQDKLLWSLFLWSLIAFFIQTRVHERHLAPAILFSLLIPLSINKKIPLVVALSIFHLANLYQSLLLLPI